MHPVYIIMWVATEFYDNFGNSLNVYKPTNVWKGERFSEEEEELI